MTLLDFQGRSLLSRREGLWFYLLKKKLTHSLEDEVKSFTDISKKYSKSSQFYSLWMYIVDEVEDEVIYIRIGENVKTQTFYSCLIRFVPDLLYSTQSYDSVGLSAFTPKVFVPTSLHPSPSQCNELGTTGSKINVLGCNHYIPKPSFSTPLKFQIE